MNQRTQTFSRRLFLQHLHVAVFAVSLWQPSFALSPPSKPLPAKDAVDHLMLCAADRAAAIAWVEQKTGVKAMLGGSHPGVGTCNALLSLGGRQYLEILAPDPAQQQLVKQYEFLRDLKTPRLFTWAAQMRDGQAMAERCRAARFEASGPNLGSRQRPDGKLMKWNTLTVKHEFGTVIPFFIEWDVEQAHPATDSPAGCRLQSLEFTHPKPAAVRDAFLRLGITAKIKLGTEAGLKAVLNTPKGKVEFS